MHYAMWMSILERLKNFEGIKSNVHMIEHVIQLFSLDVWNVLENQAWCFSCSVPQHIIQFNYVWATIKGL